MIKSLLSFICLAVFFVSLPTSFDGAQAADGRKGFRYHSSHHSAKPQHHEFIIRGTNRNN